MEGSSWKPSIAIYQGTGFSPYFREAVKRSAASIIVAHNHPSGNPSPSPEDIEVTKRFIEAGSIMGIEVSRSRYHRRSPIFKLKREGIYVTLF